MSIRTKVAKVTDDGDIRWRSHDSSRLESFSDSVFAFAITLVIVSTDVPKTFDQLYETMKGMLSFAVCFMVLFALWNQQNIFFRRYGLKGNYINFLNASLLFMVLMYAYPLRFLFFMIFSSRMYLIDGHPHLMIANSQIPLLMMIYGAGFTIIYALFYLMYRCAEKNAALLELTPREQEITRTSTSLNLQMMFLGIIAFASAYFVPVEYAGYTGYIYLFGVTKRLIWRWHFKSKGKQIRCVD